MPLSGSGRDLLARLPRRPDLPMPPREATQVVDYLGALDRALVQIYDRLSERVQVWPNNAGLATMAAGATSVAVTFLGLEDDTQYIPLLIGNWESGGLWATALTTGGFTIQSSRSPVTAGTVLWAIVRPQDTTTTLASVAANPLSTSVDVLTFADQAANPDAAGELQRNGVNLLWHNGTLAGRLFFAGGVDVPVADGGTGLSAGTDGGILGFTATGTLASSVALTANALVLGGGAGATPTALGSLGSTTTVLHGNAAGAPTFSAVSLTADVSGTLPVANGGTGLSASPITVPLGGTGVGTLAANGVLYGNGTGVVLVTAQGAANSVLVANAGAPSFSATPTLGYLRVNAAGVTAAASQLSLDQVLSTTSRLIAFGPDASTNGIWNIASARSDGSNVLTPISISAAGNVGIGTASPTFKLTVSGGYQTSGLTNASNDVSIGATGSSPNAGQIVFGDNSGWKLHFGTSVAGTFTERMTILDTGNVGIGTASPGSTLQVNGGVQIGTPTGGDKGAGTINVGVDYYINGTVGESKTITVRAAGGAADCTLIFTSGLKTGGTC